jgi:aminoglycoside phosphotransferase (APT) family kinase protein
LATAGRSTSITPTELADRLAAWLAERAGEPVTVEALMRVPGGASRETWAFTAAHGGARDRLVLRRDPPGHVIESSRRQEFDLLRAAAVIGVPVPRVRWCEDDCDVLGGAFFVMDFVDGETLARRLLRDDLYAPARAALPEQLAAAAARIHAIDVSDPALAFLGTTRTDATPAAAEVDRFEGIFRALTPDPHPALELAFRWLRGRIPAGTRRTLVHGDFRVGNVIFGPEGLRAVIDWELAHVGDPVEDLGWLCVRSWRFGADDRPAGGLCDRERFFEAYERAAGVTVDRASARWWEVCGNLKWAIMCIMQMRTHTEGHVRSVELASLGRRVAEMELELLDLTED